MTRALRPQTNGQIIDGALRTLRAQFVPLFSVVIVFQLVQQVFSKVAELTAFARFGSIRELFNQLIKNPDAAHFAIDTRSLAVASALLALFVYAAFILWQFAIGALTLAPGEPYAPPAIAPLAALKRLIPRLGALLFTLTLESILLILAIASGVVPIVAGALVGETIGGAAGVALIAFGLFGGMVVALGALLMVLLQYALVPQIVMTEGVSGKAALARSATLMRGKPRQRFWDLPKVRGSILILIVQLVTQAVVLVVSAPQAVVAVASHELGATPGLLLTLLAETLALVGEAASAPFGVLVMVGFYFDLRVRREGLDLDLVATELAKAAA